MTLTINQFVTEVWGQDIYKALATADYDQIHRTICDVSIYWPEQEYTAEETFEHVLRKARWFAIHCPAAVERYKRQQEEA